MYRSPYRDLRFLRALLQQHWAASLTAVLALLSIAGGGVALLLHSPEYLRFFMWGAVWAVVALGAYLINR